MESKGFFSVAWPVFLMSLLAILASCSAGDVYEAQSAIYDEYRVRLDTVSSHQNLIDLNDALERDIVQVIDENQDELIDAVKNPNRYKDSEKLLVKAESAYQSHYLGRLSSMILKEQIAEYTEYTSKVKGATSYDELSALNRSLNSSLVTVLSKKEKELNSAKAKNMNSALFAELASAQDAYVDAYVGKVAPLVYLQQRSICSKYAAKVADAKGYAELKQVRSYYKMEVAAFAADNAIVLDKMSPDAYAAEKTALEAERKAFEQQYMSKASIAVLDRQKQIYRGAVELFSDVEDADALDKANRGFVDVNNSFMKTNAEEMQWIVDATNGGNKILKREIEIVNACLEEVYEASDKKAGELGLK